MLTQDRPKAAKRSTYQGNRLFSEYPIDISRRARMPVDRVL
jgi:hypothetical protein